MDCRESARHDEMKGLILSGGSGTRLRPITHTSAKQLVPVANKPILFYCIEDMVEAGITDIGIITGQTADEVEAAVGDGTQFGAKVTYLHQEQPLGLAHCLIVARDFLSNDDFIMLLGDNLIEHGLTDFAQMFEEAVNGPLELSFDQEATRPSAQVLLCQVPDPRQFGVATVNNDGHIVELVEKPQEPQSDLALVGVYAFTPEIHEAVANISPSARGELEITDAIQWLIDNNHVVSHEILSGWWLDTGKKDPLLESNRRVLERLSGRLDGDVDEQSEVDGMVIVEAGARIIRSQVRGPVVIGENTVIEDSYVGPYTSIAANCTVEHSEIENSVILDDTVITGVPRLVESLIGRKSLIHRTEKRPHAVRLMVGDDSVVDVQ